MLILASRSPRRAELLRAAGIEFSVRVQDVDESLREGEAPDEYVLRLAYEKAHAVPVHPGEIILAADTTVVLGNEILGKPVDDEDACRMLRALAGRKHEVITGVCLRSGQAFVKDCVATHVWFSGMSDAEIDDYVRSGEPMDKAGAYGIQGQASKFIEKIEGPYTNVVGLPISFVYRLLRDFQ